MPDQPPAPLEAEEPQDIYIERGPLLTLHEAARLTGRSLRILQRWVKAGILPARYKQAKWPHATLVTTADLVQIATRRRWGTRRTRPTCRTTEGGYEITLRGQEATDSRLPED